MRKFNINVNGTMYAVEVEELEGSAATASATAAAPVAAPAAPAPAAKPAVVGGTPVNAPMPGTVLKLAVANGATVKKGERVVILEAMKMENDINATADGVVTFTVNAGDSVDTGAQLAVIK